MQWELDSVGLFLHKGPQQSEAIRNKFQPTLSNMPTFRFYARAAGKYMRGGAYIIPFSSWTDLHYRGTHGHGAVLYFSGL